MTTRERPGPRRTCVGCGRRAQKHELVRFEAVDGVLRAIPVPAGRGVYTCRAAACFERAAVRGAFARSLRRHVVIGPELARLYTEVSHG